MREHGLSYCETVRKYSLGNGITGGARAMLQRWERIYLTEGEAGFMVERRGRGSKGRLRKKPFKKPAADVTEFAVCDDKVYLSH